MEQLPSLAKHIGLGFILYLLHCDINIIGLGWASCIGRLQNDGGEDLSAMGMLGVGKCEGCGRGASGLV